MKTSLVLLALATLVAFAIGFPSQTSFTPQDKLQAKMLLQTAFGASSQQADEAVEASVQTLTPLLPQIREYERRLVESGFDFEATRPLLRGLMRKAMEELLGKGFCDADCRQQAEVGVNVVENVARMQI